MKSADGNGAATESSMAAAIDADLDRVLDLATEERPVFLAALPEHRRRRLTELLAAIERGGPLDQPLGDLAGHLLEVAGGQEPVSLGRRIGKWRILGRLGAGGMGVVYLVERAAGDFEQRAALKVIRWELADSSLNRRFLSERQILAQLSHPHIASLIDGGLTASGLPYLVLEYVEGEPIDRYCNLRELDLKSRLELMAALARAVDFAHRQLVVHRDIKPSNILVRADGVPKLLDFGVAKLLDDAATEATRLTPMTPRYAAPEQRRGAPVSLAADIWSLGAVMVEVLTGKPPEQDAEGGRLAAGELPEDFPSDLVNILRRCLHEDPEQRYRTASDLAEDIDRFLAGRGVQATPPTLRYRVEKWLKRHRAAVVAVLIGLVGLVGMLWQAQRVAEQRDLAREQGERAQQIVEFLLEVFKSSGQSSEGTASVRDILDRGVENLRRESSVSPRDRAELLLNLGAAYKRLGEDAKAQEALDEAAEIQRTLDSEPPATSGTEADPSDAEPEDGVALSPEA